MEDHLESSAPASASRQRLGRASRGAALWSFMFAGMSFYWAFGGTAGASTVDPNMLEDAGEPAFIAVLWLTGLAKAAGGLLALALAQPWGRLLPRWMLLLGAWAAGVGMMLYGGLGFILDGLRVAGALKVTEESAARWHFGLWDPWWFLGGLLFALAARRFGLHSRA